ncbi:MAG: c-type cytochrome [Desertimonas sp.]
MTEIPEHLLKRSRDRRSALGLGGDGEATAESTPAAATPAKVEAAAPAAPSGPAPRKAGAEPQAPAPPKPDTPVVAAYKRRAKIPYWAMGALSLLPIWAFMYIRALTEAPEESSGPIAVGIDVYGNCSSCHGAAGEGGGAGRPFADGAVLDTFPHIEDQIRFVYYGTAAYQLAGIASYGNPDREGGAHTAGSLAVMPPWAGELSDAEILGVVCHERYDLGGADPASEEWIEEFENWCSEESPIFAALEEGSTTLIELADAGLSSVAGEDLAIIPIGDGPAPGNPPGA